MFIVETNVKAFMLEIYIYFTLNNKNSLSRLSVLKQILFESFCCVW